MEWKIGTQLNQNTTLIEIVTPYERYKHLRPASTRNYRGVARLFISKMGSNRAIVSRITLSDALTFRDIVLETAKPVSWNTYNRHLRAMVNFAVLFGLREDNPFVKLFVRADRVEPTEKTIDWSELRKLRKLRKYSASSPKAPQPGWFWETVIIALSYTAMRRRQLVELVWDDIQFDHNRICLRGDFSKNHQSRHIPIHPDLLPKLAELRDLAESRGVVRSGDQVFNVTLFHPRYHGTRMTEDQVSGFFSRVKKLTGVKISAHRLRHTCATHLLQIHANRENAPTVSLRIVQQLLGHQDIRTTAAYLHPGIEDLDKLPKTASYTIE